MTESDLQQAVLELASLTGWLSFHARPARTGSGWRTAVAGDGVGFPDLVLVREGVLFVELKSDRGTLTGAQEEWLARLAVAGAQVRVWRPSDWPEIEATLTARRP